MRRIGCRGRRTCRLEIFCPAKANQFATWANLYTLSPIQVCARFPVKSIRDIKPSLLATARGKNRACGWEGKQLSLDDIEHGIFAQQGVTARRPLFCQLRLHRLPQSGPTWLAGRDLDADLDAAARVLHAFAALGVRVVGPQKLRVSSIYQWFKVDFGNNEAGILTHLRRYAAPTLLAQMTNARIMGDDYDWSINATSGS